MTETGHKYAWTAQITSPPSHAKTFTVPGDDERQAALWAAEEVRGFVLSPVTIERGACKGEWFVLAAHAYWTGAREQIVARLTVRKQKATKP